MSNFRIIQQFCAYFRASNKIIIKILSYLFLILWQIGVFDINCYTIAFLRTKDLTKSCSIKKKKKKTQGNILISSHYCKQEHLLNPEQVN